MRVCNTALTVRAGGHKETWTRGLCGYRKDVGSPERLSFASVPALLCILHYASHITPG